MQKHTLNGKSFKSNKRRNDISMIISGYVKQQLEFENDNGSSYFFFILSENHNKKAPFLKGRPRKYVVFTRFVRFVQFCSHLHGVTSP